MSPASVATRSPVYLALAGPLKFKQLCCLHSFSSLVRHKSSRAASGANFCGWPTCRMGIKPQLNPRGSGAKEEDLKPSQYLYKLQIKSPRSTRQTLCLWNIQKDSESSQKRKQISSVAMDIGGKNMQEEDQIRVWAVSTAGPETSPVLEGIQGRQRWTVTYSDEKDADNWDLRKIFIIILAFWFVL